MLRSLHNFSFVFRCVSRLRWVWGGFGEGAVWPLVSGETFLPFVFVVETEMTIFGSRHFLLFPSLSNPSRDYLLSCLVPMQILTLFLLRSCKWPLPLQPPPKGSIINYQECLLLFYIEMLTYLLIYLLNFNILDNQN